MKAYGKINLCLRVKNIENGYHNIDSVMAKIDLFDEVTLTSSKVNEAPLYDGKNSVLKALELIQAKYPVGSFKIDIIKNIPLKAGLGGSSTDAGAVLKYFVENKTITLKEAYELANKIGKDVAFFLSSIAQRVEGVQDKFTDIAISPLSFIMIKPKGGVSTKECYELYDKNPIHLEGNVDELIKGLKTNNIELIKNNMFNDLEQASKQLNPNIQEAIDELNSNGSLKSIVTGSGSAVIGLYPNHDMANQAIKNFETNKYELVKIIETKTI